MDKNDFRIRLGCLLKLYNIGKKVSIIELGTTASSLRTYQLEKIVGKIVLHCNSILTLIKSSVENEYKELDISIIASSARNIMESTNYYFYIAERKISKNEINFRYNLAVLNYYRVISNIICKLQYPFDVFKARTIAFGEENLKNEIKNSSTFQSTDSITQKQLLSGHKPGYRIGRARILEPDIESAIYNIFSNSVHGLYMGLGSNSVNGNAIYNNYIGSITLLMLACEITIIYTSNVLGDYLDLRKRLFRYLDSNDKRILNELKSSDELYKYLEYKKGEFSKSFFDV